MTEEQARKVLKFFKTAAIVIVFLIIAYCLASFTKACLDGRDSPDSKNTSSGETTVQSTVSTTPDSITPLSVEKESEEEAATSPDEGSEKKKTSSGWGRAVLWIMLGLIVFLSIWSKRAEDLDKIVLQPTFITIMSLIVAYAWLSIFFYSGWHWLREESGLFWALNITIVICAYLGTRENNSYSKKAARFIGLLALIGLGTVIYSDLRENEKAVDLLEKAKAKISSISFDSDSKKEPEAAVEEKVVEGADGLPTNEEFIAPAGKYSGWVELRKRYEGRKVYFFLEAADSKDGRRPFRVRNEDGDVAVYDPSKGIRKGKLSNLHTRKVQVESLDGKPLKMKLRYSWTQLVEIKRGAVALLFLFNRKTLRRGI